MFAPSVRSVVGKEVIFTDIVRVLLRQKRPALAGFFAVLGLVVFACSFITPKFEAASLLIVGQGALDGSAEAQRRNAETSISLARIAGSEEVIRQAAQEVGLARLTGPAESSLKTTLRSLPIISDVFSPSDLEHSRGEIAALDLAVPALSNALAAKRELNSDIIRISFRHKDPETAADFVNAIARAFLDRQLELFSRPGATDFYEHQKNKFNEEIMRASNQLEAFETATLTYSIDDEKQLLLGRANGTSAGLAAARGSIAEKTGQKEALTAQLRMLKPVTQSPFVSLLVTTLGSEGQPERDATQKTTSPADDRHVSDPPLLMVRVYQDTMVTLFKVNAELTGLEKLEQEQALELKRLNTQLAALSSREAEFSRLKRTLAQASLNFDAAAKRAVEEQISAESNAAKFSTVKVVQKAYAPLKPAFPKYLLVAGLGVTAALVAALGIALGAERVAAFKSVTKSDSGATPYVPAPDHPPTPKPLRKTRVNSTSRRPKDEHSIHLLRSQE